LVRFDRYALLTVAGRQQVNAVLVRGLTRVSVLHSLRVEKFVDEESVCDGDRAIVLLKL
jgi:hypothetical protein